jgi:hypothetical protein
MLRLDSPEIAVENRESAAAVFHTPRETAIMEHLHWYALGVFGLYMCWDHWYYR